MPLNVIDIYTEVRARRRTNTADRRFLPIISAQGNEPTGPSSATPRRVVLEAGVRIVPFDTAQILLVTPVPIVNIAEGLAGTVLFDRTGLASIVDVDYEPQQVEIQTIATGSGVTQQDKDDIENQIFTRTVEGGLSFEQLFRLMAAVAAGDIQQLPNGNYTITGVDDTTARIIGTPAANNGRNVTARDGD